MTGIGGHLARSTGERMRQRVLAGVCVFAVLAAAILAHGSARAQTSQEALVKVGFLFNFARFVDWPQSAFQDANEVGMCLVGADPFGKALDTLRGKVVAGRPIQVYRYKAGDSFKKCHVLFVSESEKRHLGEILASVRASPVLLVSEIENFLELGGMIQLVDLDNRIQFEVNLGVAQKSGLGFSSRLLKVAANVIGGR